MSYKNIEINNKNWKPIIGYENRYLISNNGEVFSLIKNKILKKEIRRDYYSVQLYNELGYKHFSIHRLVAIHFIENTKKLLFVNHKDENKLNNSYKNLEWCTASYNVNYGSAIKRAVDKKVIKVNQFDKNHNLIKTYYSFMEAERSTNIPNGNIVKCCKGERKTAGKYIWKYAQGEP